MTARNGASKTQGGRRCAQHSVRRSLRLDLGVLGKALASGIADVYSFEIHHLVRQLASIAKELNFKLSFEPTLMSDWVSRSGEKAHLSLRCVRGGHFYVD
jgi:hypothetical protein